MPPESRCHVENFLKGLWSIVPAKCLNIFELEELDLLISGSPCTLAKLRTLVAFTLEEGCESAPEVEWFWEALEELETGKEVNLPLGSIVSRLLAFITGISIHLIDKAHQGFARNLFEPLCHPRKCSIYGLLDPKMRALADR